MPSSDAGTTHIVGAGLAGLAAAVRLAGQGRRVAVHEATAQAGGRCRSYHDQATGMSIDNGMHLLLSGNREALSYLQAIGSAEGLRGPEQAEFPFLDVATGARWTLRFGDGRFPWWMFDKDSRVPRTGVIDYLPLARLAWTRADRPIGDVMRCEGPLYEHLLQPMLLAALNIAPPEGSAKLAGALIRETIALGGRACRPLLAQAGLGRVFVDPAIAYLQRLEVAVTFGDELLSLSLADGHVAALEFSNGTVRLGAGDNVIVAVPAWAAAALVPDLRTPTEFRGILNAHFRIDPPAGSPSMLGMIGGLCEWVFALPGRIAVTISDAGRFMDTPRAELAQTIWREVAEAVRLPDALPRWQIVRERRATFAATPAQNALRPPPETAWSNLFIAGDYTATGLPATIEGAIRSGHRAAGLAGQTLRVAA